ncbi:penicillin-binding protein 2 [Candidatus Kaiserbacteria bacterium]|nr:penicillin-binding protein 2 [Candidatus Kaiserbacteria bacterium]
MRNKAIVRIRYITGMVLVVVVVLIVRLYQVQIARGDMYRSEAEKQYVHTMRDLFTRGSIFFTTKDGEAVSAATVQAGYLLAIDPTRIVDPEATYERLMAFIPLDKEVFMTRADRTDRTYQEVVQQVERSVAEEIIAADLPGVGLYRNQWRYYPGGALSARTVGFIGYDSEDNLVGKYGLERYYEDVLNRDNEKLSVNFFAELFSNVGNLVFDTEGDERGDVVTTLEPVVSRTLDRVLEEAQETWKGDVTGGIIINPTNGEIYALGVVPSFDLNDRSGVSLEAFRNPLVEDVYELGSIIKPLTMASGLDSGAVTPETTYYDAGHITLDQATIGNFDGRGRGYVNMQEVLNQSLNTGVAFVVGQVGKEKFRDYFLSLKLGSETGIDLPNETYGLVRNLIDSPRDIEYATASFGQGIALTPIAAVRALSTLANGGVLTTPHIAKEIVYEDGPVRTIGFPPGEHVFKEKTSEDITRMLVRVVDEALRGGTVAIPNYSIAAKTGTAQIADTVNGGYYDDKFLHSFFGYFPAYNPQFLVFLYTVDPKGVRYASETLTDPFMELAHFLISYYNVPPDR